MRLLVLTFLFAAVGGAAADSVIVLDDDSFDEAVSSGTWMLEFYAPWCGHCKALAPIYEASAKAITTNAKYDGVSFAKIDATANKILAERYDITGYPRVMFKLPMWDKPRTYQGKRDLDGFTDWARRVSAAPVHKVASKGAQNKLLDHNDVVFMLGLPSKGTGKDLRKAFGRVAKDMFDSQTFGAVTFGLGGDHVKDDLAAYFGPSHVEPFVAKIQPGEAPEYYSGPARFEELLAWVSANKFRLVTKLYEQNFRDFTHQENQMSAVLVMDYSDERHLRHGQKLLRRLAKADIKISAAGVQSDEESGGAMSSYVFGHLDGKKWDKFIVANFNVSPDMLPHLIVLDSNNNRFFQPDNDYMDMHELDVNGGGESFLRAVARGDGVAQYEGWLGWHTRALWSTRHLPRPLVYGVTCAACVLMFVVLKFTVSVFADLCMDDEEDDEDDGSNFKKQK